MGKAVQQGENGTRRPVILVAYNPQWPFMYEEEKERILDVIAPHVVAIEHIGSTAIPGMAAKPIIDIMVAVHRIEVADECIGLLQSIGYEHPPKAQFQEKRFLRKGRWEAATHHLHIVELASDEWEMALLFRGFLRSNAKEARQYEELKHGLAGRHRLDRGAYTEGKATFIERMIDKAYAVVDARPDTFHRGENDRPQ